MLKLINHIIKEDKTRHGGSLQVTQFTQNCARFIVSRKIACILNNSELSRIGDWEGLSPKRHFSRERFAGGNIVVISPATWFETPEFIDGAEPEKFVPRLLATRYKMFLFEASAFRYRVLPPAPFPLPRQMTAGASLGPTPRPHCLLHLGSHPRGRVSHATCHNGTAGAPLGGTPRPHCLGKIRKAVARLEGSGVKPQDPYGFGSYSTWGYPKTLRVRQSPIVTETAKTGAGLTVLPHRTGSPASCSLSQCETVPCLLDPQIPTTISDVRASLLLSKTLREPDAFSRSRLSLGEGCPLCYAECVAATRKNWWYRWLYYSCHFIFYSKFQVVAGITPKSDNGKFNHQYKFLGEKWRGNWGYKINVEKNSSKHIKKEWKLYRSVLGKYRYTSLELAVRSRSAPSCPAFQDGRLPCSFRTGEGLPRGFKRRQHTGDRFTDYVQQTCFGQGCPVL